MPLTPSTHLLPVFALVICLFSLFFVFNRWSDGWGVESAVDHFESFPVQDDRWIMFPLSEEVGWCESVPEANCRIPIPVEIIGSSVRGSRCFRWVCSEANEPIITLSGTRPSVPRAALAVQTLSSLSRSPSIGDGVFLAVGLVENWPCDLRGSTSLCRLKPQSGTHLRVHLRGPALLQPLAEDGTILSRLASNAESGLFANESSPSRFTAGLTVVRLHSAVDPGRYHLAATLDYVGDQAMQDAPCPEFTAQNRPRCEGATELISKPLVFVSEALNVRSRVAFTSSSSHPRPCSAEELSVGRWVLSPSGEDKILPVDWTFTRDDGTLVMRMERFPHEPLAWHPIAECVAPRMHRILSRLVAGLSRRKREPLRVRIVGDSTGRQLYFALAYVLGHPVRSEKKWGDFGTTIEVPMSLPVLYAEAVQEELELPWGSEPSVDPFQENSPSGLVVELQFAWRATASDVLAAARDLRDLRATPSRQVDVLILTTGLHDACYGRLSLASATLAEAFNVSSSVLPGRVLWLSPPTTALSTSPTSHRSQATCPYYTEPRMRHFAAAAAVHASALSLRTVDRIELTAPRPAVTCDGDHFTLPCPDVQTVRPNTPDTPEEPMLRALMLHVVEIVEQHN